MGVEYYTKGEPADKNSCRDRMDGVHPFDHPFVQALAVFIGEFCCFLIYGLYAFISSLRSNGPVSVIVESGVIYEANGLMHSR